MLPVVVDLVSHARTGHPCVSWVFYRLWSYSRIAAVRGWVWTLQAVQYTLRVRASARQHDGNLSFTLAYYAEQRVVTACGVLVGLRGWWLSL